jgi:hypothetical protein
MAHTFPRAMTLLARHPAVYGEREREREVLFAHWPAALIAVSTIWALANSWATVAAVSGKRLGSITVGCGGQTMRTMAGMPSGSTSSTAS